MNTISTTSNSTGFQNTVDYKLNNSTVDYKLYNSTVDYKLLGSNQLGPEEKVIPGKEEKRY